MPAQHRFRAYWQLKLTKRSQRGLVQQCREECPIGGEESQSSLAQLAFQHGDLVPQHQDLHVLVSVAHGQQTQQRERVGHSEVGQSKQRDRSSCRAYR